MANEIYNSSWWGSPTATGWGNIYYEYAFPSGGSRLLGLLEARATYYENATSSLAILTDLENCE